MALHFATSQKGKPQLIRNGYIFNYSQELANGDKSWICSNYYKIHCVARLRTNNEQSAIVRETGEHNHAPDAAKVGVKEVVQELRIRAAGTQEAPQQILANVTAGVSTAVAAQLPSISSLKRTTRRVRQRENAPIPIPNTLAEIDIPQRYTTTLSGHQFLLAEIGHGNNRRFIFSTQANLQLLSRCSHWCADGTFKTAPALFEQLYTIHGIVIV